MATASDDFNRANEDPLAGNWTSPNANPSRIVGNEIVGVSGARCDEYWNPTTFSNDQYSQVRVRSVAPGTDYVYAAVRMSAGTPDQAYFLRTDGATLLIIKAIAGTFTTLQDCGVTVAVGDIIKLTIQGNTLRAYKNGSQVGTDQASGGELTSGRTGFSTFDEPAGLDDWEGGDWPSTPSLLWLPRQQVVRAQARWQAVASGMTPSDLPE